METEAKAKVVVSVLETKCIQFFAAQAALPRSFLKGKVEFILFFQIDRGKIASG